MEKAGTKFQNENLKIQEKVLETEYFKETWHECYLESRVLKYIFKFSITLFYLAKFKRYYGLPKQI